jgi:ABC-2 type transport system permease protein
MELLLTSPIHNVEIIIGKFIASLMFSVSSASRLDLAALFAYGKPDWEADLVGYLGAAATGAALIAIGTFISTTTRNQIIDGSTFAVCLLLWVLDWVSSYEQAAWAKVVPLSVVQHFEPFSKGVIDSKDVIFFVSLTFFGLFLTARSMGSLRWRA